MRIEFHVQADWDPEARVWISTSNIPGLVVEAATLPEFVEIVEALAPELLADNADVHGDVRIQLRAIGALDLAVA